MAVDIEDRIVGSFVGLAVGDALGAPVEGAKAGAIRHNFKTLRDYEDSEKLLGRKKLFKWRKPGLYTDDTQQALVLLDSLLQDRGFHADRAAARFADLARGAEFRFGVYRGTGRNFRLSVTDLRQGKDWTETGRDTAGNGAATRVAPVALYYHDQPDIMADAAARSALITHRNPVGISAAIAVARVISRFLAMERLDPGEKAGFVEETADFCREQEEMLRERYSLHLFEGYEEQLHLFSDTLRGLAGHLDDAPEKTGEWIAARADPHAGSE